MKEKIWIKRNCLAIRLTAITLVLGMMLGMNVFAASDAEGNAIQFYVSVHGDDKNPGTEEHPFATIQRAQSQVRHINTNMQSDIVVNIMEGMYYQDETLRFDERDSSTNGFFTTYKAYKQDKAVISGGIEINGWEQHEGDIWKIPVPTDFPAEQYISNLYLDNKVAVMGRKFLEAKNAVKGNFEVTFDAESGFPDETGESDMILHHQYIWMDMMFPVETIRKNEEGDFVAKLSNEGGTAAAGFRDGTGDAAIWEFEVINAYGLMTEPGTFYYDRKHRMIYYYKSPEENLEEMKTVIPNLETVVCIEGKDSQHKIWNIGFEGLTFAHTMSQYAYQYGNATGQAWYDLSWVMDERYRYPALNCGVSVRTKHTDHLVFKNNDVCMSNSIGFMAYDGTYHADISGNCFYDLGSSAMLIGSGGATPKDFEAEKGLTNVALGKEVTVSNIEKCYARSNPVNAIDLAYNSGYALPSGEWMQIDLEEKYSIDEIFIDSSGRSDLFRILGSNDETFSEYEVLSTSNKAQVECMDYTGYPGRMDIYGITCKIGDPTKYRYIRIYNTGTNSIGLTNMGVFSPDLDGVKNWGLVYDCDVSNNYITRCCTELWMQCAATIILTDTLNFTHNEFTETPYTAINLGTNHHIISYSVAKDNVIGYNKVTGASQQTQDGGPLYSSGPQKGTKIIGNYFKGQVYGMAALYPDQGSSYYEITQNVLDDSPKGLFPWAVDSHDLNIHDNYSSTPNYQAGAANSTLENTELFVRNVLPSHIQEVADFAGLTEEYEHIKNRVPAGNAPGYLHENEVFDYTDYKTLYNYNTGWDFLKCYINEAEQVLRMALTSKLVTDEYQAEYDALDALKVECQEFAASGSEDLIKYYEYVGKLNAAIDNFTTCGIFTSNNYQTIMQHKTGESQVLRAENQPLISNDATVKLSDLFIDDIDNVAIPDGAAVYATEDKSRLVMLNGSNISFYKRALFGDCTFEFTMNFTKHVAGDCPGIIFRASEGNYMPNSYIIDFIGSAIEVQRFTDNERTVFYGDIAGCEPIYSSSLPFSVKTDTDIKVSVTTKNEAEGVRIILKVNDAEMCNFVDKYENGALADPGLVGFMSPSSSVTLKRNIDSNVEFMDLAYDYDWAGAYIYMLLHNGIVSGDGSRFFYPQNDVTRAEYCKMLAETMALSDGNNTFADVTPDNWYYGYVSALCSSNAFAGLLWQNFAGDVPITRQEAAAITFNVLQNSNTVAGGGISFADVSAIAPELRSKVTALAGMGYIVGDENGYFLPEQHITKAEAAVIIYRIFTSK